MWARPQFREDWVMLSSGCGACRQRPEVGDAQMIKECSSNSSKFNKNMISHLALPLINFSCLPSFPTLSFHSHMSYPEPNSVVFSSLRISSNANTSISWLDYWHRSCIRFSVLSSSHLCSTCSNLRVFAHASPLACNSFLCGLLPLYPVIFPSFSF